MIDEVFRAQVARAPDKVAVTGWDAELTYRQLDDRAGQIARQLVLAGVRPGGVVGVHLEQSAAAMAGLLAIVRVGAAYVATDRRYPAERRRMMLADAGADVVLTAKSSIPELPADCLPICLDDSLLVPAVALPDVPASPHHIAYVSYTSGSSGRPKGVCAPHGAVHRLVVDCDYLDLTPDDVFLQHSPLAFDASTLEIWGALLNGCRLVVPNPDERTPEELSALVRREGVTVLWLTAGLFHQVAEAALAAVTGLRYLVAGGDVLSVAHVNKALAALPDTVVVNGYGPTENTTFTCCHPMTSAVPGSTVPIGKPINGTTGYILDEHLRETASGELYAGGLGVAQGYLDAAGHTAERFVPDPFTGGGARMYRTGDLVRRTPTGAFEFLGRADRQVKIRGFRVEPAEVEHAIAAIAGVVDVAVVAQRATVGELCLAAFVTGSVSTLDIRKRLARSVPWYAIPAVITRVDELPLTPAGKVDRARLADSRTRERPELSAPHRAPATPVENAVVQLWIDLLGIDGIGADDDFFELGGHSLIGVRVIADLHREYGTEVQPVTFYLDPTPAGLARALESACAGRSLR